MNRCFPHGTEIYIPPDDAAKRSLGTGLGGLHGTGLPPLNGICHCRRSMERRRIKDQGHASSGGRHGGDVRCVSVCTDFAVAAPAGWATGQREGVWLCLCGDGSAGGHGRPFKYPRRECRRKKGERQSVCVCVDTTGVNARRGWAPCGCGVSANAMRVGPPPRPPLTPECGRRWSVNAEVVVSDWARPCRATSPDLD